MRALRLMHDLAAIPRCLDVAAQPFKGSVQIRYANKRRVGFEATLPSHYSRRH